MLTDSMCKAAVCPADKKRLRLSDNGDMLLEVTPAGGKWWRFRYRFAGTEKMLSLGIYPTVRLKQARAKRDEAKAQLSQALNPSEARKA